MTLSRRLVAPVQLPHIILLYYHIFILCDKKRCIENPARSLIIEKAASNCTDVLAGLLITTSYVFKPRQKRRNAMKQLVETIARALVDEPDVVSIREVGGMYTSILELKVAKSDIGKIIGKQGRTVSALRTLLSAVAAKLKKRTVLEIIE